MMFQIVARQLASQIKSTAAQQIVIAPGEVRSLDARNQYVRLVSGKVWISFEGKDFLLKQRGERQFLARGQYPALIASANKNAVVIEIQAYDETL